METSDLVAIVGLGLCVVVGWVFKRLEEADDEREHRYMLEWFARLDAKDTQRDSERNR